jgi:hypothetical protein
MHTRTATILTIAALTLTACGSQAGSTKAEPTPTPTSASPSPDITDQLIAWRDGGGSETLQKLVDNLTAVDEASDPIDFDGLREACSTLTADIETAQLGAPIPDEDTNNSWNLALDHLAKSATACTNGAVSESQDDFDLMASEMDIGIKHLDAVNKNIDEALDEG